jgi:hypothetical protein
LVYRYRSSSLENARRLSRAAARLLHALCAVTTTSASPHIQPNLVRHPGRPASCPRDAPLSCSLVWPGRLVVVVVVEYAWHRWTLHIQRYVHLLRPAVRRPVIRHSYCSPVFWACSCRPLGIEPLFFRNAISRSPPLGLPGPRRRPASVLTASVRLGLATARTIHLFAHTPSDLDRLTSFFVASVVFAPSDPCSYSPLRFRGVNRARAVKQVWDVRA